MKTPLDYGIFYHTVTQEQKEACCNGMGAEWMPDWSRSILDYVFDALKDAVDIHDVDFCYYMKDKTWFHIANNRMKQNMLTLVDDLPWYRYFKKRGFRKIWIPALFFAVENGGWSAFKKATVPEV